MYTFKRNEIVILLGAGASVDAGVPHSTEMINRVENLIAPEKLWSSFFDLYHYVRSAIHYSDGIKGKIGDSVTYNIERLVESLDELSKRDEHTLYPFVGAWNPKLIEVAGKDFKHVQELREKIVEILRRDWVEIKQYEDACYYEGLIQFQKDYEHPIRIFTLNYDLGVEKACEKVMQRPPERGFENRLWDWRLFDDSSNDPKNIFLYKLHGSTDWKRNENGTITYVDSPSSIPSSDVAIIFGTSYKLQYHDPFLFLAYEFRKWTLESKLIISVGYGFGDSHINAILRQALNNDPNRKLLSVTPSNSTQNEKKPDKIRQDEVCRIESLLQLNQPGTGQVDHMNYSAKDFLEKNLTVNKLAALFTNEEPELFPEISDVNTGVAD